MTRPWLLVALIALLGAAATARADEPTAARDAAPTATPRIRATHRVDVIAPGEKVESVIDRMRAQGSGPARGGRATDAPTTPADRRGERLMDPRSGAMMSPGATGASGAMQGPMPGGMPGMGGAGMGGTAPRGDAPPPDRMRHR